MYEGTPTTQSGTFQMTTISLGSAFEGMGNANSGYRSKTFEKFVNSLRWFPPAGGVAVCRNGYIRRVLPWVEASLMLPAHRLIQYSG